jgi:cytosine/adenosine deaminase-related metal-dependent hydrolase
LNPGAKGDVTVINLTTPFNSPVLDPIRALIYYSGASDIRFTLVDGEVLYREGRVVGCDVEAIRLQAAAACHHLWQAADKGGVMPEGSEYRSCGH